MEIYISRSGERYGPYSLAEVQADIDAGNIQPTDLAWHEGVADWSEVWQLEGITLPKRRVPPPPPRGFSSYPNIPRNRGELSKSSESSSGEMAILVILAILIPIAGLIIGIVRMSNPEKQSEGATLLVISIVLMIFYVILFSQF